MELVVNVSENWGIGNGGDQLVYISADLKRFRQLTTGKTVILGRKTLATFPGGRPLKNRRNLILSRGVAEVEGAEVFPDLPSLLKAIAPEEEVSVIGGASVYQALLPYCHKAYITKTLGTYPADTFFPNLDQMENWVVTEESGILEEDGVRFKYMDYVNQNPLSL